MFRKILFWAHLCGGLAGGIAIAIMSFTGAALTFEKDIVAWAERDARRIEPPGLSATRFDSDAIIRFALIARPEAKIQNLVVSADPRDAVMLGLAGNVTLCVNPYSGEVREALAPRTRAFMQAMRAWHFRLNFKPEPGNTGAKINGVANVVFVFLALSGLVLWWPRIWNLRAMRPSLWFVAKAQGKARDWNWHNVIGLWSLPLLLVLAGSGVVMSYRWAGDLVFRLAGETPPVQGVPPPSTPLRLAALSAGQAPLPRDALLAAAQQPFPEWTLVTLRFNPPLSLPLAANPPPRTATLIVKERNPWPPFATSTLTLDAFTGEVARTDNFAALSTGLQARRWIRLLHSGEALGRFVQLLSGLACVGGCFLVYTGFALAWRRFFSRSPETEASA